MSMTSSRLMANSRSDSSKDMNVKQLLDDDERQLDDRN